MAKDKNPFDEYFNNLLKAEGGWSDTEEDRGGKTNLGITIKTLQAHDPSATVQDLKNITKETAKEIYIKNYYLGPGIDKLPAHIREQVFDISVNSGPGTAIKFIQELGGSTVDGIIGPNTIAAASNVTNNMLADRRQTFYDAIIANDYAKSKEEGVKPTQFKFKNGWKNRANSFRTDSVVANEETNLPLTSSGKEGTEVPPLDAAQIAKLGLDSPLLSDLYDMGVKEADARVVNLEEQAAAKEALRLNELQSAVSAADAPGAEFNQQQAANLQQQIDGLQANPMTVPDYNSNSLFRGFDYAPSAVPPVAPNPQEVPLEMLTVPRPPAPATSAREQLIDQRRNLMQQQATPSYNSGTGKVQHYAGGTDFATHGIDSPELIAAWDAGDPAARARVELLDQITMQQEQNRINNLTAAVSGQDPTIQNFVNERQVNEQKNMELLTDPTYGNLGPVPPEDLGFNFSPAQPVPAVSEDSGFSLNNSLRKFFSPVKAKMRTALTPVNSKMRTALAPIASTIDNNILKTSIAAGRGDPEAIQALKTHEHFKQSIANQKLSMPGGSIPPVPGVPEDYSLLTASELSYLAGLGDDDAIAQEKLNELKEDKSQDNMSNFVMDPINLRTPILLPVDAAEAKTRSAFNVVKDTEIELNRLNKISSKIEGPSFVGDEIETLTKKLKEDKAALEAAKIKEAEALKIAEAELKLQKLSTETKPVVETETVSEVPPVTPTEEETRLGIDPPPQLEKTTTTETGLSTTENGEVVGPDGKVINPLSTEQQENVAKNFGSSLSDLSGKIEPFLKQFFGLETQDVTRAIGFYLMSRASGASHEGSMRWAGTTVLKQAEKRDILNAKGAATAATAFAKVSSNYKPKISAQIKTLLAAGKLVEAQALMGRPDSLTEAGKYGIDVAESEYMMRPGHTTSIQVFTGADGNSYIAGKRKVKGSDGKTTEVDSYIPIPANQRGTWRKRDQTDDRTGQLNAVKSFVGQMNSDLFNDAGKDGNGDKRFAGIFASQGKAGVVRAVMQMSDEQRAAGLPDDPTMIMTMLTQAADLATKMGVKEIDPRTLLDMQLIGGDILFDTSKLTNKSGELAPASSIKSFTNTFQESLVDSNFSSQEVMNTAALKWSEQAEGAITMESISNSSNYAGLNAKQKSTINNAPTVFMAWALLAAYDPKNSKP